MPKDLSELKELDDRAIRLSEAAQNFEHRDALTASAIYTYGAAAAAIETSPKVTALCDAAMDGNPDVPSRENYLFTTFHHAFSALWV